MFSRSVDAIVAKNWMKKITGTMVDMELEDNLKLKVATRLIYKSVVICMFYYVFLPSLLSVL